MMINPALKEFRKVNGKRHERHLIELSPSEELRKAWYDKKIDWDIFELSFIQEVVKHLFCGFFVEITRLYNHVQPPIALALFVVSYLTFVIWVFL